MTVCAGLGKFAGPYRRNRVTAKLPRVLRPASGAPGQSPLRHAAHALFGCDPTERIVSVSADHSGRARVWRRTVRGVELTEHHFSNWFLITPACLDLISHLPFERLPAEALRDAHGELDAPGPLTLVELDNPADDPDAYAYLLLTSRYAETETTLLEMSSKRDGGDPRTLADLRGLVLACDPVEQFLTLTGRTYFKGMRFEDVHRFQFDLETTGLNEERDRIFMVSLRDSTGWEDCLETNTLDEASLIARFVAIVQERDPDVLENHNVFAFDLSFLARRASRLGVRLALGRDGSEPRLETDVFDAGERAEPFLRWRIAGREVVDTQHAVRRFGARAPDMRRHGLKDAARYFGFARVDREYVAGIDVWPTYRSDPERIRRYASADVEEVDGLSRRLLPPAFGLASVLPRPYERIAADASPSSLWELLLVRGYLQEGCAIPPPTPRIQRATAGGRSELLYTGVFGHSVRAVLRDLLPSLLAQNGIAAANDVQHVLPRLVAELLGQPEIDGATELTGAAQGYLAAQGLFSDPGAASDAMLVARRYIDRLLMDLRQRGCTIIELDGEQVLFATPHAWAASDESAAISAARTYLPEGVELAFDAHFRALYARAPRSTIMIAPDGGVTLAGSSFRAGRFERFGEAFMLRAAPHALLGDVVALRRDFLETVHLLRTAQFPLEELCALVTLHKSPPQYRRSDTHEEPYEVLLAAGVRSWRVGQRIRYFRARGGEPRLLQEGEGLSSAEADSEYYVQRLVAVYCQQLSQAFRKQDFVRIFRLPGGVGPFVVQDDELADIRTITAPTASEAH
jgi:DNA polymerase I